MVEFNGRVAVITFNDGQKWVIDLYQLSKLIKESDKFVQKHRNHSI